MLRNASSIFELRGVTPDSLMFEFGDEATRSSRGDVSGIKTMSERMVYDILHPSACLSADDDNTAPASACVGMPSVCFHALNTLALALG